VKKGLIFFFKTDCSELDGVSLLDLETDEGGVGQDGVGRVSELLQRSFGSYSADRNHSGRGTDVLIPVIQFIY
jgi:hypothetical protein